MSWSRPRIPPLVTLAIVVTLSTSGCGSGSTTLPGPSGSSGLCGQQAVGDHSAGAAVLDASELLRAEIIVDAGLSKGRGTACVVLESGQNVHVQIGDRLEFVANYRPTLDPGTTKAVRVSTSPAPADLAPNHPGGETEPHVIVTLQAAQPGSVTVEWTDCSGTGC